jgi:hypothetical protein
MNGYMNLRYKAVHYYTLVSLFGHKYLEPKILCGWYLPKRSTSDIDKVTCPDCNNLLQQIATDCNKTEASSCPK